MAEAEPHGAEWATCEHPPSVVLPADARLPWVPGDYDGFDEDALPHGDFVAPATLVTRLLVETGEAPLRPGARDRPERHRYQHAGTVPTHHQGAPAPSRRHKLLWPAGSEISGLLVGLEDVEGGIGS